MSSDTAWIIIDEIIHLMNIKGEFARSIDLETSIEAIHVDNKKSTIYWFTHLTHLKKNPNNLRIRECIFKTLPFQITMKYVILICVRNSKLKKYVKFISPCRQIPLGSL